MTLPIGLVGLFFAKDWLEMSQAHQMLYHAAQMAALSGSDQRMYSAATSPGGQGFTGVIDQTTATQITNQDFSDETQSETFGQNLSITGTQVSFPTATTEQFAVTATYTPTDVMEAFNVLSNLFAGNWTNPLQPMTWTVAPTESSDQNGANNIHL